MEGIKLIFRGAYTGCQEPGLQLGNHWRRL